MSLLSRLSLRWRLLSGFVAAAVMTVLAGGGGIMALRQVAGVMDETASDVTTEIERQVSQIDYVTNLREVVDQIGSATDASSIGEAKTSLLGLRDTSSAASVTRSVGADATVAAYLQFKEAQIEAAGQEAKLLLGFMQQVFPYYQLNQ